MAKAAPEQPVRNIVVGLDLGTTKTCALIAEVGEGGDVQVIGMGLAPSSGLKRGQVVHIDNTVDSIAKAVHEAERMAGVQVGRVFVGVAGEHIRGITSNGVVAVSRKDKEITQEDVDRSLEQAKAVNIPPDREIIHVLPQEYLIDNQDGIRNPVGMAGVRLESVVHIISGSVTAMQNITKSVERAGYGIEDVILQPLASAHAVLTPDEKELGVALVDIGGGTTDVVIFWEGAVRYAGVVPLGGNQFTRDVAIGLRTPNEEAEEIKRQHGCALVSLVGEGEEIAVAGVGGRAARGVPRRTLAEILQPRMEEILSLVDVEIRKSRFDGKLAAGVVLTGGQSQMEGILPLAEAIFKQQVRVAGPRSSSQLSGLTDLVTSPAYATAVGLVTYGAQLRQEGGGAISQSAAPSGPGIFSKVKRWIGEYF
jgi:cell division protein FtsA